MWGSLFTTRFGPNDRGVDPNKLIVWGEFVHGRYTDAEFDLAVERWKALGYTHCVIGPLIDETGYHGTVPATDFRRDTAGYLARIERIWAAGIIPVLYLATDNWTLERVENETGHIYRRPEWQRVIRMVAPHGFEPSADTPNHEHVAWCRWGRETFPNALIILHTVSNLDAPGNNDDFTPDAGNVAAMHAVSTSVAGLRRVVNGQPRDLSTKEQTLLADAAVARAALYAESGTAATNPRFIGFAEAWRRVAPYCHQWHAQYGPFETSPEADPAQADEVRKLFPSRFKTGHAGWPTFSAFGASPIDHIFAEYGSYTVWHNVITEQDARAWGDVAAAAGADGCFDGVNRPAGD